MSTSTTGRTTHDMEEAAFDLVGKAGKTVDETITSIKKTGSEVGEQVSEVAGNIQGAVKKSVADQPTATLMVAGALGFVLGALWKS